MYVCKHACMYVCMYGRTDGWDGMYDYVGMLECMYVCMLECMHVCMNTIWNNLCLHV